MHISYLAPHAFAVAVGDDAVLLDARAGRYYCLPDGAFAFDFAARVVSDPAVAEELAAAGLATAQGPNQPLAVPPGVQRELQDVPRPRMTWAERRDALLSYAGMIGGYYHRPFGAVVGRAQGSRLADRDATPDLVRRVMAFRSWLPWAPFPGVCLFRSRMLLAFLRHGGLDATWVFGVRTWPFEAHCWLQSGDLVLDDTVDNVLNYTPIFQVGR